jgi:hypothetical protein
MAIDPDHDHDHEHEQEQEQEEAPAGMFKQGCLALIDDVAFEQALMSRSGGASIQRS